MVMPKQSDVVIVRMICVTQIARRDMLRGNKRRTTSKCPNLISLVFMTLNRTLISSLITERARAIRSHCPEASSLACKSKIGRSDKRTKLSHSKFTT